MNRDMSNIFEPYMRRDYRVGKQRDYSFYLGVVFAAFVIGIIGWVWTANAMEKMEAAQIEYSVSTTTPLVASAMEFCEQAIRDWEGEEMPKAIVKVCGS